jgi:hypothetical protein
MEVSFTKIEMVKKDSLKIQMKGDPVVISQMISAIMDSCCCTASVFIDSVTEYCLKNNITLKGIHVVEEICNKKM